MFGSLSINLVWLATVFLLSLRLAAIFLMTPLLAAASVPVTVRVLLILSLAAALSLGIPDISALNIINNAGALFQAGFNELALGATLALGILIAFSAFSIAGRILDIQIGFGLGQVIDPASNASLPILTSAFNQVAVVVFFLVNGHQALLRGIVYSLHRFPLGHSWLAQSTFTVLLKQLLGLFGLGFALASPIIFSILMVEMALGVVARNLPQMNMLVIGIPVKIVIGLITLALWFVGIGDVMNRVYASIYRTWDAVFAAATMSETRCYAGLAARSLRTLPDTCGGYSG